MKDKIKKILKDKKSRTALLTFVIILLLAGVSFAWFSATVTGNDDAEGVEVTTANLSITYNGGPEFNEENILQGWTGTKTFTVENTGDATANYNINWGELTNGFTNQADIVYSVTSTNNGGTLAETQLPASGENLTMISSVSIPIETTQTYTITFRYINRASSQDTDQGKTLSGKIQIQDINWEDEPTFSETILENTPPTNTTVTAPGRVVATTNEGLIEGPDDDYGDTTYYYRGAVTNNYVSFAGLTWRIIRINGDGTVRMILDNYTSTTGVAWNTNWSSIDYNTEMGYVTYSNSTIKGNVETWYNTNIGNNTDYSDKIATTKFCSDKSGITSRNGDNQYFASGTRLAGGNTWTASNASPIMTCPTASDIYNLNVGLMTSDEVAFAGGGYTLINQSYYLYNSNITTPDNWWTITPGYLGSGGYLYTFSIGTSNGKLDYNYLNRVYAVRPVISINADVTVTTASPTNPGTSSNPYIIQ